MQQIKKFEDIFVNISLGLILGLLISYIFFPSIISVEEPHKASDYILTFGLIIFGFSSCSGPSTQ